MLGDLRHAGRLLLQRKGWTGVVVLSIALGIGANVALFNALNGLLFKTLDGVDRSDTLVRLKWVGRNDMVEESSDYERPRKDAAGRDIRATFSYPAIERLRAASGATLAGLAAGAPRFQCSFAADGQAAEIVAGFEASGNFFQVLGVPALVGRTFVPTDDAPSAAPVAVLSEGFWKRRFGGRADVVGKVVQIDKVAVTVVGVTPARFTGIQKALGTAPDVTVPLALDPRLDQSARLQEATWWWLQAIGRVKPGITAAQVQGSLDGVFRQAARAGWDKHYASLSDAQRANSEYRDRTAVPQLHVDSAAHGIYDAALSDLQALSLGGVVRLARLRVRGRRHLRHGIDLRHRAGASRDTARRQRRAEGEQPRGDRGALDAVEGAPRRAGGDVARAARRRGPLSEHAAQPPERRRRVRQPEPDDLPHRSRTRPLRTGPRGRGVRRRAAAPRGAARRSRCQRVAAAAAQRRDQLERRLHRGPRLLERTARYRPGTRQPDASRDGVAQLRRDARHSARRRPHAHRPRRPARAAR